MSKVKLGNKKFIIDKNGNDVLENHIKTILNETVEKISKITNELGYPVAYDIKRGKILKVKFVKELCEIKKNDRTIVLDVDEIEEINKTNIKRLLKQ